MFMTRWRGSGNQFRDEQNANLILEVDMIFFDEDRYWWRLANWWYLFKGLVCILLGRKKRLYSRWVNGFCGSGSYGSSYGITHWWDEIGVDIHSWHYCVERESN